MKEPWEMRCEEFADEYKKLLVNVAKKQEKGGLDSSAPNYKDISEEEFELLKKDWKEFSKLRGYNNDDIKEYERWLVISGRRDFNNALWLYEEIGTRGLNGHICHLYMKFIELAREREIDLSDDVIQSYNNIKKEIV